MGGTEGNRTGVAQMAGQAGPRGHTPPPSVPVPPGLTWGSLCTEEGEDAENGRGSCGGGGGGEGADMEPSLGRDGLRGVSDLTGVQ